MDEQGINAVNQNDRENFYIDVLADIHKFFVENNASGLSRLKKYMDDEGLFSKLEDSMNGENDSGESVLTILDGEYFIFGDNFSEKEISLICSSYVEDDDLDSYISISNSFDSAYEEGSRSVSYFIANFPGNILGNMVSKLRNTPLARKVRDQIDHINGM